MNSLPNPTKDKTVNLDKFEEDLARLINRHSVENIAKMPDFLLAKLIVRFIRAMGPCLEANLKWHHTAISPGKPCSQN